MILSQSSINKTLINSPNILEENYLQLINLLSNPIDEIHCPVSLMNQYIKIYESQNDQQQLICSYFYTFHTYEQNDSRKEISLYGIITPCQLGEISDMKLFTCINNQKLESQIKIKYNFKINFREAEFQQIYEFNKHLFCDFYDINNNKRDQYSESYTQLFEFNSRSKLLIIPTSQLFSDPPMLNWKLIREFNHFVEDDQMNEQTISDFDLLNDYYLDYIVQQKSYQKNLYCIHKVINNPSEILLYEVFKILEDLCDQNIYNLCDIYELNPQISKKMKFSDFLKNHKMNQDNNKHQLIFELRKLSLQSDMTKPFLICSKIKHISQINYLNHGNNQTNNLKNNTPIKLQLLKILPIEQVVQYPIKLFQMDLFSTIQSLSVQLQRFEMANQLAVELNIQASNANLLQSTSMSSFFYYDKYLNYEILEVVGDSILKSIISIHQFNIHKTKSEKYLSRQRQKFINNKYLSIKAYQSNIHKYLKQDFCKINLWNPPIIIKELINLPQQKNNCFMTPMNLADVLEALIGACYNHSCNLFNVTQMLNDIIDLDIQDYSIFQSQSSFFIRYQNLSNEKYDSKMNFQNILNVIMNEKVTWEKQFKPYHQYDTNIPDHAFDFLEENIINYKFKDRKLLIQAFNIYSSQNEQLRQNYQRLEFIGDAILEAMIIFNCYKRMEDLNLFLDVDPNTFQKIKIFLLSNNFMGKMTCQFGLHNYILNLDQYNFTELKDATGMIFQEQNSMFKDFVHHNVPKLFGDIWESLCGAMFIDGGIEAVVSFFGKVYSPFIQFCVLFHKYLNYDLIEQIKLKSIFQNIYYHIKQEKSTDIVNYQLYIDDSLIKEFSTDYSNQSKEQVYYKFYAILNQFEQNV